MNLLHNAVFVSIVSLGLCSIDTCSANSFLPNLNQLEAHSIAYSQDLIQLSPSSNNEMVIFQRQRGGQQQRGGGEAGRGGPQRGGGPQQQAGGQQRGGGQQGGGQQNGQAGMSADQVASTMMQNFDADGDGSLNLQELTEGLRSLEQSMRQLKNQSGQTQGCEQRQRGIGPANNDDTAAASENLRRGGPRGGPRGGGGGGR